jgi:tetratricopeptide (TPR) repeat protein
MPVIALCSLVFSALLIAVQSFPESPLSGLLKEQRAQLGVAHPASLSTMVSYASFLSDNEENEASAGIFLEAYETLRASKGENAVETLVVSNNLATVYHNMGSFEEASKYFELTLEGLILTKGEDHDDTLMIMDNAADHYWEAQVFDRALNMYRFVLNHRRAKLGETAPEVLAGAEYFATKLMDFDESTAEAGPLLEEVLAARRLTQSDGSRDLLSAINNYAMYLHKVNRLDEAEPLFREALSVHRAMSTESPEKLDAFLRVSENLAILLREKSSHKEAEELFREIYTRRKELLGEEHPVTLNSCNNLASILHMMGFIDEALPLYESTLYHRRKHLGPEDPDTLSTQSNYATILLDIDRASEAVRIFKDNYNLRKRVLGDEHKDTLRSLVNLANGFRAVGKAGEANRAYKGAVDVQRRTLGDAHPDTITSMENFASYLIEQDRKGEATVLFRAAVAARRQLLGDNHRHTQAAIKRFATFLAARGATMEADELRKLVVPKSSMSGSGAEPKKVTDEVDPEDEGMSHMQPPSPVDESSSKEEL